MSISYKYLVLSDRNIEKLEDSFGLDVDKIYHLARNGDLNLYIRLEKIRGAGNSLIKTEFGEIFELESFINYDFSRNVHSNFFSVDDYNIDFFTEEEKKTRFGAIYRRGADSKKGIDYFFMLEFEGFVQIPARTINESEKKITMSDNLMYHFLGNEDGEPETKFALRFSFEHGYLDVPIHNTYILLSQLNNLVNRELIKIKRPENKVDGEIELSAPESKESELNKVMEYDADLPEGINEERLAYFIELIIDPELLDDGKIPSYSKLHSALNHKYKKGKIPSKNTIKKYLNQ